MQICTLPHEADYWTWCDAQFNMAEFRNSSLPFQGFDPAKAKCARDKLPAEVEVQLRAAGRILHPCALLYATKADMHSLVASLPAAPPKKRLKDIGKEGVSLLTARKLIEGGASDRGGTINQATEQYPGWAHGPPYH